MKVKPVTAFLLALSAVVVVLAGVAVVQSRLAGSAAIDLEGDWLLDHRVQWGPFKSWTFRYRLRLVGDDARTTGDGATLRVNGRRPEPGEQTTLQVVDLIRERGNIIAWVFERNGDRAGRGAIKWRVVDQNRLVGTFATTFYRGVSVAQRISQSGFAEPTAR